VSEEWRRIAEFRRSISSLRLFVTADAEIEIRSGRTVLHRVSLSARNSLLLDSTSLFPWLPPSFSVFLNSVDPQCQCEVQANYIEEVTTLPLALDMRYLYGPMGLGIPMLAVTGMPIDWSLLGREISETAIRRPLSELATSIPKEQLKEEKQEKPIPGITRLQAFKRELEEEKPKKKQKRNLLSRLKHKRGE